MVRVFVSHASADSRLAVDVREWLVADGHEVFLDLDLVVGDDWEQRLHERLRWADAVVCVVTAAFVASPWCAAEVGIARSRGLRVLPVLADPGVRHPMLAALQYTELADARTGLAEALRSVGRLGWPDSQSPFPGLRPFDPELRRAFFGRAAEVTRLAELVRSSAERSLVLVVGPSGCGKSSLVRAGLVPVIADEPDWWTVPPFTPGVDPVGALARELAGPQWTLDEARDRLAGGDLTAVADEVLFTAPGRRRRLLLVVDQFEELLTQTPPERCARFVELLRSTLGGPVRIVATLRPEFSTSCCSRPRSRRCRLGRSRCGRCGVTRSAPSSPDPPG